MVIPRKTMHSKRQVFHVAHLWGARWVLVRRGRDEPLSVHSFSLPLPGMGVGGWRDRLLGRVSMLRPKPVSVGGESSLARTDTLGLKELPGLRSFFLDASYADGGGSRENGVMIIKGGVACWSCTLKEPAACTQFRLIAPTWDEMLLLCEAAVLSDGTMWETDPWEAKRKGRKR